MSFQVDSAASMRCAKGVLLLAAALVGCRSERKTEDPEVGARLAALHEFLHWAERTRFDDDIPGCSSAGGQWCNTDVAAPDGVHKYHVAYRELEPGAWMYTFTRDGIISPLTCDVLGMKQTSQSRWEGYRAALHRTCESADGGGGHIDVYDAGQTDVSLYTRRFKELGVRVEKL